MKIGSGAHNARPAKREGEVFAARPAEGVDETGASSGPTGTGKLDLTVKLAADRRSNVRGKGFDCSGT
jgi:hypothetical protein